MADENIVEAIEDQIPEELVIMLRKAVAFGGQTYDRLILREPTAGQMMEWDKLSATEADVKAVAVVSGLPEPAVRMIGARDLIKAAKHISRFL